jgi:selenocysteine lyase/cysteine desulfurase
MGMVRVSFGMYNNHDEVDLFINALNDNIDNREK